MFKDFELFAKRIGIVRMSDEAVRREAQRLYRDRSIRLTSDQRATCILLCLCATMFAVFFFL
jgi:hypothetical protein